MRSTRALNKTGLSSPVKSLLKAIPSPPSILPLPSFHPLSNPVHCCRGDVAKYTHSPTEDPRSHTSHFLTSPDISWASPSSPSPPPPPPSPRPPAQDPPLPMRLSLAGFARPAIRVDWLSERPQVRGSAGLAWPGWEQQPVRPPKGSLCPSAQPRPHPAPAKDAQTTPHHPPRPP